MWHVKQFVLNIPDRVIRNLENSKTAGKQAYPGWSGDEVVCVLFCPGRKKRLGVVMQLPIFAYEFGGADRDRTDDLMTASHALSQLSYSPKTNWKFNKRSLTVSIPILPGHCQEGIDKIEDRKYYLLFKSSKILNI